MRKGGHLQWKAWFAACRLGGMPLHVGGRFALSLQGHEHYLRLGDAGTITLYGPGRSPGWLGKLPLEQRFEFLGKGAFDLPPVVRIGGAEKTLSEQGLTWHQAAPGTDALVSTPERAMLELCDGVAGATLVHEADALMQAMTTLRPQRVSLLLRHCHSIKAKRVFLALAERHRHAWLAHVSLEVSIWAGENAHWCLVAACIRRTRSLCRETLMSAESDHWDRRYTDRVHRWSRFCRCWHRSRACVQGGTAINLFEHDPPRLSVDIDLACLPVNDYAEDA